MSESTMSESTKRRALHYVQAQRYALTRDTIGMVEWLATLSPADMACLVIQFANFQSGMAQELGLDRAQLLQSLIPAEAALGADEP